jgi:hypothetical protein
MSEQMCLFAVEAYVPRTDCPCHDCGTSTLPDDGPSEFYIVHHEVWAAAGVGRGYLCIGCLEERLGRRLNRDDFPDYPVNDPLRGWNSDRLLDRLLGLEANP